MKFKTLKHGIASEAHPLCFLGRQSRGGVYVLRFRVTEPFEIPCGRFKRGRPVAFAAGEYLYVGNATAQQGAVCLARRLVRHASRLGGGPPHAIREKMLVAFPAAGLCDGDVSPRAPKRPKWNVDHPLDHPAAALTGAYLIRTGLDVEAALGKFMENDHGTVVFEPGLGANDINGNTHLLRVTGGEAWWAALPKKLNKFARLSNMWPGRADDILARVAAGTAFGRAVRESEGEYDTVGWHEVPSRLWRGRGAVLKAAAVLGGRVFRGLDEDRQRAVAGLVDELKAAAEHLRAVLDGVGGEPTGGEGEDGGTEAHPPAVVAVAAAMTTTRPTSFNQVTGMLNLCVKFVAKNARDVPQIRGKTGATPAAGDVARARTELARIDAAADRVLVAVTADGRSSRGRAGRRSRRGRTPRPAASRVDAAVARGAQAGNIEDANERRRRRPNHRD